jgi:hypothetical protein
MYQHSFVFILEARQRVYEMGSIFKFDFSGLYAYDGKKALERRTQ